MRAISRRIPELGMSTFTCSAWLALRRRVSMSAIGSVIIGSPSPAALRHPRDDPLMGQFAEADPADAEPAVVRPRAPAPRAAMVGPGRVLRGALLLDPQ